MTKLSPPFSFKKMTMEWIVTWYDGPIEWIGVHEGEWWYVFDFGSLDMNKTFVLPLTEENVTQILLGKATLSVLFNMVHPKIVWVEERSDKKATSKIQWHITSVSECVECFADLSDYTILPEPAHKNHWQ